MSKYEGAICAQNERILKGKMGGCEATMKGWGFNLADEKTHLLTDAAMLMHLEAPEAPKAISEAKERCGSLVASCYKGSLQMREDLFPHGVSVENVINYMVTDLDYSMVTTANDI